MRGVSRIVSRRLVAVAVLLVLAQSAVHASDPAKRLARIPTVDRARYADEWHRRWRNPGVLVDREAVYVLVDGRALGEGAKPVADVAVALARLPRRSWPYGRIVALSRTPRVDEDIAVDRVRARLLELGVETIETPVGCNCEN